jgi:hypothetical protein
VSSRPGTTFPHLRRAKRTTRPSSRQNDKDTTKQRRSPPWIRLGDASEDMETRSGARARMSCGRRLSLDRIIEKKKKRETPNGNNHATTDKLNRHCAKIWE